MKHLILSLLLILSVSAFAQTNVNLLGSLSYTQDLNDIWGYADSLGNEYALVGTQTGVSIVDVTNPSNPIELHFISGVNSTWRDLKVWNDFAYVTNETGNGLMIIDLNNIQDSVPFINNTSLGFSSAHNIYIDEFGVAYIFGANATITGAIMYNVDTDPWNPALLGTYNANYIHDGMVANNIMYVGEINAGQMAIVDVTNKAVPVVLATQPTLSTFTHAVWISDDTTTAFTVDEVGGSFIESFDISNLSNIQRLDAEQSSPGNGVIPHNIFNRNDFLVASYYRDGVVIFDVDRPHNMIEIGNYDTSPAFSGGGFNGCWGVYPYLPSGNIIASDIENGLIVLGPTYIRACYLEGVVTDSITGIPINGASVQVISTSLQENTSITGNYATGTITSGTYTVQISKAGYITKIISGVVLNNGILTQLDVELVGQISVSISGTVVDSTGTPIPDAQINFYDPTNAQSYDVTTNASGNFSIASFFPSIYNVTAGKWGYVSDCSFINVTGSTPIVILLEHGYCDDFTFDFGWNEFSTASTGKWIREEPIGTSFNGSQANPEIDVSGDCTDKCFMTGNGGGSGGTDDVDNGYTQITSPVFNLSNYDDPYISFYTWFYTGGGSSAFNDTLVVRISNGTTTTQVVLYDASSTGASSWVFNKYRVADFVTPTSNMTLIVDAADEPGLGHIVEGGFDSFKVTDSVCVPSNITITTSKQNVACNGAANGNAQVIASGGVGPNYTYSWNTNPVQTTQVIQNLDGGFYTATVTDGRGCTATSQIEIRDPSPLVVFAIPQNSNPTGSATGEINQLVSGGIAPYIYNWSNGGQTEDLINLVPGIYFSTVIDRKGCALLTMVTIN